MAQDSFNLRSLKRPVFECYEQLDGELQARTAQLDIEKAELQEQLSDVQRRREELITLRAELEHQLASAVAASYGIFACCFRPTPNRSYEAEARRERRRVIQNLAVAAFEQADANDDRELTLEELRQIEGDNAEFVMQEADVDGDGVLTKREYVNYKIHVAKEAGKAARKAFKSADVNHDGDLTLAELRVIEGDNAERVMREADVDGSGALSKREYVDYKIRMAAHRRG